MSGLFCGTCAGSGYVMRKNMHEIPALVECPDCSTPAPPPTPKELSAPDANHVGVRKEARGTERQAALAAYPKSGSKRLSVLRAYTDIYPEGMTHEELSERMGDLASSTWRARASELEQGGWLEDSGQRRKTHSGHASVVWRLTQQAALKQNVLYRLNENKPYAD